MTDTDTAVREAEAVAADATDQAEASAAEAEEATDAVDETESEDAAEGTSEDEGEEGDGQEEEAEAEEVEIDFGGNKLTFKKGEVPDELAEKVQTFAKDIWADYTRKSQDTAEVRKAAEAAKQAAEKLTTLSDDALEAYSHGKRVEADLVQLQEIDVGQLWQSNPDRARQVSDAIARKQAELQQVVSKVDALEKQQAKAQDEERQRLADEGKRTIEKRVKGFSAEKVVDYVTSTYGMDREVAARDWPLNPAFAEMAHKAMLFDNLQAKAKASAAPPKKPAQPVKATATKGGGHKPVPFSATDPYGDRIENADEWMRKRMEQKAKRQRA